MWRSRLVARRQWCRNLSTTPRLSGATKARKEARALAKATFDSSKELTGREKFLISIRNGTFYQQSPSDSDAPGSNPPFFEDTTFHLRASENLKKFGGSNSSSFWAVISPAAAPRTRFLQALAGQFICTPPSARTYPELSAQSLSVPNAIKYVGFDAERGSAVGGTATRGAYLSARYESRREETDFSLRNYLTGHTELNALERAETESDKIRFFDITELLDLRSLLDLPVSNLSNGQTRRARIAKALMAQPKALLLDGPFMGLDPRSRIKISNVLGQLAQIKDLALVISLDAEETVPKWIQHAIVVNEQFQVVGQSPRGSGVEILLKHRRPGPRGPRTVMTETVDGIPMAFPDVPIGEPIVEMRGVKVSYGDKTVLGDWTQKVDDQDRPGLWWDLHRGQRCGIFGANGSGKTTMLSLITSDHPQTYSLPIKLFGRSRLPAPGEPGISVFDLQKRMGHSSPEVHSFFPKRLSVRRVLESAWADAPLAKAPLTAAIDQKVNALLRWFEAELDPNYVANQGFWERLEWTSEVKRGSSQTWAFPRARKCSPETARRIYDELYEELLLNDGDLAWADRVTFGELSFSSQRLALFLRAIIASPDLVILDEAFSGMDEAMRTKALMFLSHGEKLIAWTSKMSKGRRTCPSLMSVLDAVSFEGLRPEQALLVISHAKEDVPGCVREWICLPDPGEKKPPRTGALKEPLGLEPKGWEQIWGTR